MRYFINTSEMITRLNSYINSVGNRVGNSMWMDYLTSSIKYLRAGRNLPWMRQEYSLQIFNDVFKYPLKDDFDALVDCNPPLIGTHIGKQLTYSTEKEFKRMNNIGVAIGWEQGEKYLLCRAGSCNEDQVLDDFDDEEAVYTLSGDASNPVIDTTNYRSSFASLRFNVAATTNQFIISRTIDSVDVSEVFNLATIFIDCYMPVVLPSLKLRFGNNSSNYYETAALTNQYSNTYFVTDWNQLGAMTSNMTQTGTVDLTDITYIAVVGDCTGVTANDFRLDGLIIRVGVNQALAFNSYNIVKVSDSSNTWQAKVDDVNNLILWDQDYDDLLMFKALEKAGFFNYRDFGIVQKALTDMADLYQLFENRYPSQEARNRVVYYRRNRF